LRLIDRPGKEAGMSWNRWGIVLGAVGLVILAASLLADRIGIGSMPGVLGWKQILGAGAGLLLLAVGVMLARRRASSG
jgi:hypothetical protein